MSEYQKASDELFAELATLKGRSPDALGRVGINGVDGDVSVTAFPRQKCITAVFGRDHMAQMDLGTTKKLIAHLRSGGSVPVSPATAFAE